MLGSLPEEDEWGLSYRTPKAEVVAGVVGLEGAVPPPDTDLAVGVGHPPRHHLKKGTAVTKKYQIKDAKTNDALVLAVPDYVTIAMGEVAEPSPRLKTRSATSPGLALQPSWPAGRDRRPNTMSPTPTSAGDESPSRAHAWFAGPGSSRSRSSPKGPRSGFCESGSPTAAGATSARWLPQGAGWSLSAKHCAIATCAPLNTFRGWREPQCRLKVSHLYLRVIATAPAIHWPGRLGGRRPQQGPLPTR